MLWSGFIFVQATKLKLTSLHYIAMLYFLYNSVLLLSYSDFPYVSLVCVFLKKRGLFERR